MCISSVHRRRRRDVFFLVAAPQNPSNDVSDPLSSGLVWWRRTVVVAYVVLTFTLVANLFSLQEFSFANVLRQPLS
jgi:hypothetical protein